MYNIKYRRFRLIVHFSVFLLSKSTSSSLLTVTHVDGPPAPEPQLRPVLLQRHHPNLTACERKQIVSTLLFEAKDGNLMGKLRHGAITAIANTYNAHRQTIRKIWERARENVRNEDVRAFTASPRKKGNCGRKKWNHQEVRNAVREILFHQSGLFVILLLLLPFL
jgi:hypothetical protein